MSCCHYYQCQDGHEQIFSVDVAAVKYGHGALTEVGDDAVELGIRRAALFVDAKLQNLALFTLLTNSLRRSGVDFETYSEVRIEPTDESFKAAAQFARENEFDGFISLGGGSTIDTCKAANLYSTYPAEFLDYVNAPVGGGRPIPGPLKPHIACPTTCGTGSECTGIAVFDLLSMRCKTGIASRYLRPHRAIIDPTCSYTLPGPVVAASGFDVLSHALESYTARPFTRRTKPTTPQRRPMSQGANPYSDLGCREALRLCGEYLLRAVNDAHDTEARDAMMFAATLAGIAFGNSGVHIPHGMSYSVAGMVKDFRPPGYPKHAAICPHGMSVIVNAPAAFRFTANACPERHLAGAKALGAEVSGATNEDAAQVLSDQIIMLMRQTHMPNGISGVGYSADDASSLAAGAIAQQRLLDNAPRAISEQDLIGLYTDALAYW